MPRVKDPITGKFIAGPKPTCMDCGKLVSSFLPKRCKSCAGKFHVGNLGKYGVEGNDWAKGKVRTEEHRKHLSESRKGKVAGADHHLWMGDKAKYGTVHQWTRRHLGRPDTCVHCGIGGLTGRQIHWANIDHRYRRKVEDWIRLCAKCHAVYDKGIRLKQK